MIAEMVLTHCRAFDMPAGRPLPHGESHAGSLALEAFHSTKSSGSRLFGSTSTRSPARRSSSDLPDNLP